MDDKGKFVDEIKNIKNNETVIYLDYNLNKKTINFKSKDDKNKLITLCKKLDEENILTQMRSIDFKKKSVINMKGKSGITICLNKNNNIGKNVRRLKKVLVDLKNRKELYGKVDLTYNNYILYSPYYRE